MRLSINRTKPRVVISEDFGFKASAGLMAMFSLPKMPRALMAVAVAAGSATNSTPVRSSPMQANAEITSTLAFCGGGSL